MDTLSIYGYPGEEYRPMDKAGLKLSTSQLGLTKKERVVEQDVKAGSLFHKISTLPGQSGSPIILEGEDGQRIIGVHKGGVKLKETSMNC